MPSHDTASGRNARLFRNGRSQAVRIPREFELPWGEVTIRKEGNRLILEAAPGKSLKALLESFGADTEEFPQIEDTPPRSVDL